MIREENLDLLREYLELRGTIKELEERVKEISPEISALLMDEPDEKFDFEEVGVTFRNKTSKTWEYSDDLSDMIDDINTLKAKERKSGAAKVVKASVSPTYSWNKK